MVRQRRRNSVRSIALEDYPGFLLDGRNCLDALDMKGFTGGLVANAREARRCLLLYAQDRPREAPRHRSVGLYGVYQVVHRRHRRIGSVRRFAPHTSRRSDRQFAAALCVRRMMVAKYPERLTRSTDNPLPVDQPLTVATPRPADVLVDMLWNDTGMPAQAPLEREFLY